jgi:hypothetical protein
MRILKTIANGAATAVSSYKLILVVWVTTLVLTLAVGFPLKSFLNGIFGNSMAVSRLSDGFDLGIAGDMGKPFGSLMAAASAGTVLAGTAGFFIMTFFAGGLFRRFTIAWGGIRISEFLKASADNFMPFLKIALLMMLIIGGYTLLLIGVPAILITVLSGAQVPAGNTIYIFWAIWALGMPVWLFVADASRRWLAATGSPKVFRALGAGFRALREKFWLSYGTVLAVTVINILVAAAIFWFTASATPDRGITVFLFFLASQALVVLRLMMKAWRYASVCDIAR